MAELKKCPFCGSDNITMMGKRENCFPWIRCECCGASTSAFETQEEAIEAWNNRATESEIRAKAIDEFAEKIRDWQKEVYQNDRYAGELDFLFKHIYEIAEQLKGE